jgi:hypothetical protein
MTVIYKYPLAVTEKQYLKIPYAHEILCVKVQKGVPCIWVELLQSVVDQGIAALNTYCVLTLPTGLPINLPDNYNYIGTYFLDDGLFVGHVYMERG